jgi:hypothetical protein
MGSIECARQLTNGREPLLRQKCNSVCGEGYEEQRKMVWSGAVTAAGKALIGSLPIVTSQVPGKQLPCIRRARSGPSVLSFHRRDGCLDTESHGPSQLRHRV